LLCPKRPGAVKAVVAADLGVPPGNDTAVGAEDGGAGLLAVDGNIVAGLVVEEVGVAVVAAGAFDKEV